MNPLQLTDQIDQSSQQTDTLVSLLFDRLQPILLNPSAKKSDEGKDTVEYTTNSQLSDGLASRVHQIEAINSRLFDLINLLDLPEPGLPDPVMNREDGVDPDQLVKSSRKAVTTTPGGYSAIKTAPAKVGKTTTPGKPSAKR